MKAPPIVTRGDRFAVLLTLVLLVAGLFGNGFWLSVASASFLAAIAAVAYNLLIGYAGQLSFGHAGYLAVGAYTAALLATRAGWPLVPAVLVAMVTSGIAGALTALPARRVKGLMLALATLSFAEIAYLLAGNLQFTGGWNGIVDIPSPSIFGFPLGQRSFYVLIGLITLATVMGAENLLRSHVGRDLLTLKSSEELAESVGIRLWWRKVQVFSLAGALTGLAGALTVYYLQVVSPSEFTVNYTVEILAISAVAGFIRPWRAVPSAILLAGGPVFFNADPGVISFVYALLLVIAVMVPEVRRGAREFARA